LEQDVTRDKPRRITELGAAHVPEDRQRDGLVLTFPCSRQPGLNTYYQPPFTRGVVMQESVIMESANRLIKEFDIRTPSP